MINWKIPIKNEKGSNLVKHACPNIVAMETSKLMDKGRWCQIVPR